MTPKVEDNKLNTLENEIPCTQYINIDDWLSNFPVEYAQITANPVKTDISDPHGTSREPIESQGIEIVTKKPSTPPKISFYENKMYSGILILDPKAVQKAKSKFFFRRHPSEPVLGSYISFGNDAPMYANVAMISPVYFPHGKSSSCSDLKATEARIRNVFGENTTSDSGDSCESVDSVYDVSLESKTESGPRERTLEV